VRQKPPATYLFLARKPVRVEEFRRCSGPISPTTTVLKSDTNALNSLRTSLPRYSFERNAGIALLGPLPAFDHSSVTISAERNLYSRLIWVKMYASRPVRPDANDKRFEN
jgi:hypothetical protein